MERTYAAQVRGADEIKVCGFVENIRNKSKMAFIVLKDITGKVQITVERARMRRWITPSTRLPWIP